MPLQWMQSGGSEANRQNSPAVALQTPRASRAGAKFL